MKRLGLIAGGVLCATLLWGNEEVVDGVTWHYQIANGMVSLTGGDPAYTGDLVVPDQLGGCPVTEIQVSAFGSNPNVTSVSLPRGVSSVGLHTFCNCSALTNVTSRAPFVHYGESSLSGTALRHFAVPEGETYLDIDLFHRDVQLESVTLPSTIRTAGRAVFYGCTSLKELRFPACFEDFGYHPWDAHWTFKDCTSLTDIYFLGPPPQNLESTGLFELQTKIHYPRAYAAEWEAAIPADRFGGCTDEPNPGTETEPGAPGSDETEESDSVTSDGICSSVVDGVAWRYRITRDSATLIGGEPAYTGDLVVPDALGGCPVTEIHVSAFGFNPNVTSVSLPHGVSSVGLHTFCGCSALTNVTSRAPFVHYGESSLSGTALRHFAVPEGETYLDIDLFHQDAQLESVTLPSTIRTAGRAVFYGCTSLKELRFPACFEDFGYHPWDAHWTFKDCTGLTDIYFLGPPPQNLESTGLFELQTKIHYPRAYAAEWEAVIPADRFGGHTDEETADPIVPDGIYSSAVDGVTWRYQVTNGKASLMGGEPAYTGDLVVPDVLGGCPVTEIMASAFGFNPNVTSVSLPCGVSSVGLHTFCGCSALTNVTSRAPFIHYGESSLSGTALRSFEVPEGETNLEIDLFNGDVQLESVILPSTLTSMGRSVFVGCSSLKEIRFPAGFSSFARTAYEPHRPFYGCTELTDVYFFGHVPENFELSGLLSVARIHYPSQYLMEWRAVVPSESFGGYSDGEEKPRPPCTARVSGYVGVYDGDGHGVTVESIFPDWAKTTFATSPEGPFLETAPQFTNAGVNTVWCRVEAVLYRTIVLSATVEIRPQVFRPGDRETAGSVTATGFEGVYDGAAHAIAVDVSGMPDAGVAFAADAADFAAGRSTLVSPVFTNVTDATVWYQVTASNYTPYVGSAVIRIQPRPLTLSSRGGSKVYDGQPLVRPEVIVGGCGFAPGEGAEMTVTGSQTEIGSSENTFLWTPVTGTLTSNYEVVTHYGLLRVTRTPDGTVLLIK